MEIVREGRFEFFGELSSRYDSPRFDLGKNIKLGTPLPGQEFFKLQPEHK